MVHIILDSKSVLKLMNAIQLQVHSFCIYNFGCFQITYGNQNRMKMVPLRVELQSLINLV